MYLIFKNIFRIQKSCFCNQYFLYSKKVEQELYTFWIHTCKVIRSITLFCLVPYFSKVEVEFGRACFCFPIFLSLLRLFKHGYLFYLFINGFIFYLLRSKIKWYDQRPNFFDMINCEIFSKHKLMFVSQQAKVKHNLIFLFGHKISYIMICITKCPKNN